MPPFELERWLVLFLGLGRDARDASDASDAAAADEHCTGVRPSKLVVQVYDES